MNILKNTFDFLWDKYFYIIAISSTILGTWRIKQSFKENKKMQAILLLIIFLPLTVVPAYKILNYTAVEREEFSTNDGKISFLNGNKGNIYFVTSRNIDEPIDLRIKDTWIRLVQFTDYSIDHKKKVTINYEFGDNDKDNKMIASKGLIFTYKTTKRH